MMAGTELMRTSLSGMATSGAIGVNAEQRGGECRVEGGEAGLGLTGCGAGQAATSASEKSAPR